jgi:hypothetical protein
MPIFCDFLARPCLVSEFISDLRKKLLLVVVEQLFLRITCEGSVLSMIVLLRSANASRLGLDVLEVEVAAVGLSP